MVGKMSTVSAILLLICVTSVFLSVNAANKLTITTVVTKGKCDGENVTEVLRPCIEMADQITVSTELTVKPFTGPLDLVLRKLVVRLLRAILLTREFNLNEQSFGQFCQSMSQIATCMNNTVNNCATKLFTANVNKSEIRSRIQKILHQLPLTDKGSKASCNPSTGAVSKSFTARLKKSSIKDCINQMPSFLKSSMVAVAENIGDTKIDRSVKLTTPGKSGKMARAVCRKLDDILLLFKLGSRCNSEKCNGKVNGEFGFILQSLMSTPGIEKCGKEVKEEESIKKTGEKLSKERSTILSIGLGHIYNSRLGSSFETCIMKSGEITLINSDSYVINASIATNTNASGYEYSFMSKVSVIMFGDKENCGKVEDTPTKSVAMGKGIKRSKVNTKTKCGKKNIFIKTLEAKQNDSSRIRIVDQCSAIATVVRCLTSKIGEVCYLTVRLSKSAEMAGELFSGCANQVSVPGISDGSRRRRKRAASSELKSTGTYDASLSGDPALKVAAELTADDEASAEEADSESLGGSGMKLAANFATVAFAVTALAMNL